MKAILRETAHRDLEHIAAWIANDQPLAAERVLGRILDDIVRLSHFPLIGRAGVVAGTHEWVVVGLPYVVVYVLDEARDDLIVIAVFHVARDR